MPAVTAVLPLSPLPCRALVHVSLASLPILNSPVVFDDSAVCATLPIIKYCHVIILRFLKIIIKHDLI